MPLHVNSVTFDSGDARTLASFWGAVFGVDAECPNDFVAFVKPDGGPNLMFIAVPEVKTAKNRVHLDLHADDIAGVDAETDRLISAGATLVGEYREYGTYWRTLQDPEGNELCIGTPESEAVEPPA